MHLKLHWYCHICMECFLSLAEQGLGQREVWNLSYWPKPCLARDRNLAQLLAQKLPIIRLWNKPCYLQGISLEISKFVYLQHTDGLLQHKCNFISLHTRVTSFTLNDLIGLIYVVILSFNGLQYTMVWISSSNYNILMAIQYLSLMYIYGIPIGDSTVVHQAIGHVALLAITVTMLMTHIEVKSLQLIWRSGTCRYHLWVPNLQMGCSIWLHHRVPG